MGLFTDDEKIEDVTPSVVSTARKQLEQFIKDVPIGTDIGIPTREITDLSPLQQEIIKLAGGQATSGDFNIAADVFRQAAQKDVDVATSPEYAALRQEIDKLRTEGATDIRQRAELGGQLKSTPAAAIEAETSADLSNFLIGEFARLQRQGELDKQAAALGLTGIGTERLGQLGQAAQLADQERVIEQARSDAIYDQALKTVLLPYQEQLNLLTVATQQQPFLMQTGGGLTDLGFAATIGGQAAAAGA